MTLNASGPISLGGSTAGQSIALELGLGATSTISFQTTTVRSLSGTGSGTIVTMPTNFYGKSYLPTWVTPSGSLGSVYTFQGFSATVNASSATNYTVVSGGLPSGLSLNASNGVISGTVSDGAVPDYTNQTISFTIRATTAAGGSADRAFSIFVLSRYVGYQCTTGNEGDELTDTAPAGFIFNGVKFSSYGTPNGSCGAFTIGGCNSAASNAYNPTPCTSYSTFADNNIWGDPCNGTSKRMYIQMSYGYF